MSKGVSVVLPAYNEQDNVAKCLTQVYAVIKKLKLDAEIILVNDGSKDKTEQIAKSFLSKVPILKIVTNRPNRVTAAPQPVSTQPLKLNSLFPADNQFDFSQISLLLKMNTTNADIVSGIRAHDQDFSLYRKILRWVWNTLVRAIFGYLATDVDCGFKLLDGEFYLK